MKPLAAMCFALITSDALAQSVVPPVEQKTEDRIFTKDNLDIESYYRSLLNKQNTDPAYLQELKKLQDENERLKKRPLRDYKIGQKVSPPSEYLQGSRRGNVPGNVSKPKKTKKVRSAPPRTFASGLKTYGVTYQEEESLSVLPAASFVRAKMLSGARCKTGSTAYDILLELDYGFSGPNYTKIPLQGCRIIASCLFDLSIKKAVITPHTMSCVRDNGGSVQRKISAFAADRHSEFGVGGVIDMKQDEVFFTSLLAGIVKGASLAYIEANKEKRVVPLNDNQNAVVEKFTGKFPELALARGVLEPASNVTQFYLNQAKALLPTIGVGSGDELWVITTDSVEIPDLRDID